MNLRLAGEAGIDFDDWRECRGCGEPFEPDVATRYHCSEKCAAARLFERLFGRRAPVVFAPEDAPEETIEETT